MVKSHSTFSRLLRNVGVLEQELQLEALVDSSLERVRVQELVLVQVLVDWVTSTF